MEKSDVLILNAISEAKILSIFKIFCKKNSMIQAKSRLREIYSLSQDKIKTTSNLIFMSQNCILNDQETKRMYQLISSYLYKSSYRKSIENDLKNHLLLEQDYKCAICGCKIGLNSHADHIVPFKYVGDELENNWQILCQHCNEKKSDSIDYQIKYLLNLI